MLPPGQFYSNEYTIGWKMTRVWERLLLYLIKNRYFIYIYIFYGLLYTGL